jgi:hypothetical protein
MKIEVVLVLLGLVLTVQGQRYNTNAACRVWPEKGFKYLMYKTFTKCEEKMRDFCPKGSRGLPLLILRNEEFNYCPEIGEIFDPQDIPDIIDVHSGCFGVTEGTVSTNKFDTSIWNKLEGVPKWNKLDNFCQSELKGDSAAIILDGVKIVQNKTENAFSPLPARTKGSNADMTAFLPLQDCIVQTTRLPRLPEISAAALQSS